MSMRVYHITTFNKITYIRYTLSLNTDYKCIVSCNADFTINKKIYTLPIVIIDKDIDVLTYDIVLNSKPINFDMSEICLTDLKLEVVSTECSIAIKE